MNQDDDGEDHRFCAFDLCLQYAFLSCISLVSVGYGAPSEVSASVRPLNAALRDHDSPAQRPTGMRCVFFIDAKSHSPVAQAESELGLRERELSHNLSVPVQ